MEDDVAPNALVEEGSHHVEEDVEDPEEGHDKSSYFVAFHKYDHDCIRYLGWLTTWMRRNQSGKPPVRKAAMHLAAEI